MRSCNGDRFVLHQFGPPSFALDAAWYVREEARTADQPTLVARLGDLKPHFDEDTARHGFEELERLERAWSSVAAT